MDEVGEPRPGDRPSRSINYGWVISVIIIGTLAGGLHSWYVSELFENDRHFSHLSELEREMSLRSEMGFYYSYYKTIVEENPLVAGINKLMNDKLVEYPKEVNALNRFNIHPEVILGSLYRALAAHLPRSCRVVSREPAAPVRSCTGAGEPVIFYLGGAWAAAGLTVAAIFGFGCLLSDSLSGGALSLLLYAAAHAHATRVMWAPTERENLAQPLLLLQAVLLTAQLRSTRRATLPGQVVIATVNCLCLLFWQFSQFIFLTQMAIYFLMEELKIISWKSFCIFLHHHFCGLHMAILLLQGNDMLKSSLYASLFVVLAFYGLFLSSFRVKVQNRVHLLLEACCVVLRLIGALVIAVFLKKLIGTFLNVDEDTHVWEILYSKFSDFANFHTMIYTCSDVYDFLPASAWWDLTVNLPIPLALLAVLLHVKMWHRTAMEKISTPKNLNNDTDASDEDSGIDSADAKMADAKKADDKMAENKMADCDVIDAKVRQNDEDASENEKDQFLLYLGAFKVCPGVFYNVCQMAVFGVMAALVMRLQLLFVPHLCIVAATLLDPRLYRLSPVYMRILKKIAVPALVMYLAHRIWLTVLDETSNYGEFSDPQLEELLEWITANTPASAAFAAPLPLTAAIMLSARRPIVNHPHYEHKEARDRNYIVYKAYGRFPPLQYYEELSLLRVSYLVVDRHHCFLHSSRGCTFDAIWARAAPELSRGPRLCAALLRQPPPHFYRVFGNARYTVLRVHDLSIRYMPRAFDT